MAKRTSSSLNKGPDLGLFLTLGLIFFAKGASAAAKWTSPVKGEIKGPFGPRINPITGKYELHEGVDIAVPLNTPIKAPQAGKVANVYKTEKGGLQIILSHNNGFKSGYAHLAKALVKSGDEVTRGEMIGLSGKSGQVTGPHLHLTLRDKTGKAVNPAKFFSLK